MFSALNRLIELDVEESAKQRERVAFMSLMGAVIEALPDGLVVIDLTGKILFFNQQAELLFGYHRSQVIGRQLEMLMPEHRRARHVHQREMFGRFDISKRPQSMGIGMNLAALREDGHEFMADITLARMVAPSGILLLASVRCAPRLSASLAAAAPMPDPELLAEDHDAGP